MHAVSDGAELLLPALEAQVVVEGVPVDGALGELVDDLLAVEAVGPGEGGGDQPVDEDVPSSVQALLLGKGGPLETTHNNNVILTFCLA